MQGPKRGGAGSAEAGFTLLEMIVVLAVLALVAGLFAMRGPPRSAALDLRAAAGTLVQDLRLARATAIARNASRRVLLDPADARWQAEGGAPRALPPGTAMVVRAAATETGGRLAAIRFAPDGSSTGGWIELADGRRRMQLGIDWLSGRVSLTELPADAR
ncbi:GspH/FimT family pseudopilin [Paracraurococcus lichenis]|uniref:Type II secretion system protein H n=1 Tax=Paracraurococcus lichenis TaxID=3064888 RepID=A0ABT9E8L6_9PROT|nr:GspH/FimT family pseudopilin [Paracraurococcus sp. LOR1-02]MDO9712290.1 GspH/FimT family pseudopilin [Paracraurococcus sp. LOR1-02]